MQKLKYLIFLLFNLAYKDGKPDESNAPYFNSVIVLVVFQYFILFIALASLNSFIAFTGFFDGPLTIEIRGQIIAAMALLVFVNYYFFVKKKYFDRLYNEFKDAAMNTKRNRRIGYACFILYWVIVFIAIGNLKRWLS
ncbi:MAG: hypothetical protein E6Q66_10050 [Pedobacter sp.]|nr:MAG: hypothetical protein E6Q66_10050 [Pedobacter sp.]